MLQKKNNKIITYKSYLNSYNNNNNNNNNK